MSGRIELIIGPMFAGKSTELLRRLRRYAIAKKRCKRIKHEKDNLRTSSNSIVTHDDVTSGPTESLPYLIGYADHSSFLDSADVIGIDEGQFFPDIVEYAEFAANLGKIVIIAALDSTFEMKPFHNIASIVAEKVIKLSAVCYRCSKSAAFTKRIGDSKELELVGGSKDYVASCRDCFSLVMDTKYCDVGTTTATIVTPLTKEEPYIFSVLQSKDVKDSDIPKLDLTDVLIKVNLCEISKRDSEWCELNDTQQEELWAKLKTLSEFVDRKLYERCANYAGITTGRFAPLK